MTDPETTSVVPADKFDTAAVEAANKLGFPGLNPVFPELLKWVQDMNWPVAKDMIYLIGNARPDLAAEVVEVFRSRDEIWKLTLINEVWPLWRPDMRAALSTDLLRLKDHPTRAEQLEEVHLAAERALSDMGV